MKGNLISYFCPKTSFINGLLVLIISVMIFCMGCNNSPVNFERRGQNDNNPPSFVIVSFPFDGQFIPEGRLIISGTLIDDTGFHSDEPVLLAVDVTRMDGQVETHQIVLDGGSPETLSYFDYSTGNFRFDFFNERRFKPGIYKLRLTGKDVSSNVTSVEANIEVGEVSGVDPAVLVQARAGYGQMMKKMLTDIRTCLLTYGDNYEYDSAILGHLASFIDSTYINKPERISAWTEPMAVLVSSVMAEPIPDVSHPNYQKYTEIKPFIDLSVQTFQQWLFKAQSRATYPWYPVNAHYSEIIALRQKPVLQYDNNVTSVVSTSLEKDVLTCHILIHCVPFAFPEQKWNVADFHIIAEPGVPLNITGFIGGMSNRIDILPEHYDPPIKLFNLFYLTGVDYQMVVKIL